MREVSQGGRSLKTVSIQNITKEPYKGVVHNLGIRDIHNYFCQGFLVSNCYASSIKNGECYKDVPKKIEGYFGSMSANQRPFQVAIGGGGEPTLHPQFAEILKTFHELGIVPNYTTNGMHISHELLEATERYCGGVAVSTHPHLLETWRSAVSSLLEACPSVSLALHHIISDARSVREVSLVYDEWQGKVETHVLLPLIKMGNASDSNRELDYDAIDNWVSSVLKNGDIAFGAKFYEFLLERGYKYDVALYPPEIMSKYLILDDEMRLFKSSFDVQ